MSDPAPALGGKVSPHHRNGRLVVVKRYPRSDTAAYQCWGSGGANERPVGRDIAANVPALIRTWSNATDEFAERLADLGLPGPPVLVHVAGAARS